MSEEHPLIELRERPAGAVAALRGSRITVANVMVTLWQSGSFEEAAQVLDLSVEQVEAAWIYYLEHAEEIDANLAAQRETWEALEQELEDEGLAKLVEERMANRSPDSKTWTVEELAEKLGVDLDELDNESEQE